MNMILVHIGSEIPEHFYLCVKQARRFYSGPIFCITNANLLKSQAIQDFGLTPVDVESLTPHPLYQRFEKSCFLKGFWNVTAARLILVEILMAEEDLTQVIHIENDVLIYENPEKLIPELSKRYKRCVALTPIGKNYITAAYSYIDNCHNLDNLTCMMMHYMEKGEEWLKRKIGQYGINEMTIISQIYKDWTGILDFLPVQPTGPGCRNVNPIGSMFDAATYGQHLDGTPSTPGTPMHDTKNHFSAPHLKSGKYELTFVEESGLKIPYLKEGVKNLRLNNLHIHSKRLERFM